MIPYEHAHAIRYAWRITAFWTALTRSHLLAALSRREMAALRSMLCILQHMAQDNEDAAQNHEDMYNDALMVWDVLFHRRAQRPVSAVEVWEAVRAMNEPDMPVWQLIKPTRTSGPY